MASATGLQNYFCDSCTISIEPTNPRIHCISCEDYDLCANCAIGERFTKGHNPLHQTQIFKECGGAFRYAVPSVCTITYVQASQYTNRNQSAPPPVPPRPENIVPPVSAFPPRSDNLASAPYTAFEPLPNSGWQPFFLPDMSPTPTYTTLMNDIFTYLDPQNTGVLLPETFSRFLDDMGYLPHENSWKSGLTATFNTSKESNADKTLKNAFDLFSIDHNLLHRVQPPHVDPTGLTSTFIGALGGLGPSTQSPAPPMPAITRKGFIDICTIEILSDPSREWGNLSRLLRRYNLPRYRGREELPRSVLPAVPDQAMLNRVAGVAAFAKQKGEREVEAARVNAMIAAKGQQAAIDVISDTRYEYRYY